MNLTPREFSNFCDGAARADNAAWRRVMWGAWHAAAFMRAKKLPGLAPLLRKLGGPGKPRQSAEQMLGLAVALNAAWGGKDLRKKAMH
jgi:hypothetical protein